MSLTAAEMEILDIYATDVDQVIAGGKTLGDSKEILDAQNLVSSNAEAKAYFDKKLDGMRTAVTAKLFGAMVDEE